MQKAMFLRVMAAISVLSVLLVTSWACSNSQQSADQILGGGGGTVANTPIRKTYTAPPKMQIDTSKSYTATIKTKKGDIVLELFAKDVPNTVNNFVFLARDHFYDNTTFHRVIPGFMAQGGDPTGTGAGSPGYQFADEFTSRKHVTGTLSMANAGKNTNGSQFFICYAPQPHLDGVHTVFGQLKSGMDVLTKIQNGDAILTITITEK